jgi:thiol-disulfide isomerase/thioredoxin
MANQGSFFQLVRAVACLSPILLATSLGFTKDAKADLSLKDLNGKRVRLRDYAGKIVVLNFWATWCGPCREEMPRLQRAEKEFDGVIFIGVSLDDNKTKSRIPDFVREHAIDFPIWVGATADDLDRLDMGPAVPATAFIDADGRIVARVEGEVRDEEIKERIEWLLHGESGTAPQPRVVHLEKEK